MQSKEISGSFTYWPGNLIFGDVTLDDSSVYSMELICMVSSEDCEIYENLIWQSPLSPQRDFTFLLPKCRWNNSSFEIRLLSESSRMIQHSQIFSTGVSEIFFLPLIVPDHNLYTHDIQSSYQNALIYSNTKNAYLGISRYEMIYIFLITFTFAVLNILFSRPIHYKRKKSSSLHHRNNHNTLFLKNNKKSPHTHDFIDYLLEDGDTNNNIVIDDKNKDLFYSGPSSFHFVRRTTNYAITHSID